MKSDSSGSSLNPTTSWLDPRQIVPSHSLTPTLNEEAAVDPGCFVVIYLSSLGIPRVKKIEMFVPAPSLPPNPHFLWEPCILCISLAHICFPTFIFLSHFCISFCSPSLACLSQSHSSLFSCSASQGRHS